MNTHNLVLCESADGWSLHRPGSTDEDIASGDAPYLLTGTGEPAQADYDAALEKMAQDTFAFWRDGTNPFKKGN